MEMVDPGLVSITQWRPDTIEVGKVKPVVHYGAVARKP
ncbi:MAG: SAM-dependent methyltransferase [Pseudonocardiaceae bacterium]